MKYILTFLLLIHGTLAFAQGDEWLQVGQGDVKVWLLKKNVDVTASKEERTLSEKLDIKSFDEGRILKKFEESKKQTLSLLGIKEWKVESSAWETLKDGHKLTVVGSYLNAQNEKINFIETHIYKNSKVIQYLNTWPTGFGEGASISKKFLLDQQI